MTRKALISVTLFFVMLFVGTFVFANDAELRNAGNTVTNVVKDAGAAVKDGTQNIGNDLQKGASRYSRSYYR